MVFEPKLRKPVELFLFLSKSEQVSSNISFGTPSQCGKRTAEQRGKKCSTIFSFCCKRNQLIPKKETSWSLRLLFLRSTEKFNSYKQLLGGRPILINLGSFLALKQQGFRCFQTARNRNVFKINVCVCLCVWERERENPTLRNGL